MRKWHVGTLILAAVYSAAARAQWFTTDGLTYCRPLSQTIVMRDYPVCNSGQVHCTTSVECWTRNWFRSTGLVVCRARGRSTPPSSAICSSTSHCAVPSTAAAGILYSEPLHCPGLRDCALDPNPELMLEQDLWRWSATSITPGPLTRSPGSSGITSVNAH